MRLLLILIFLFSAKLFFAQNCPAVPSFKQGAYENKYSVSDGNYKVSLVVFSDGIQGKLFKGGMSGRFYIENKYGVNTYFDNLCDAIQALYAYKKKNN